ncbi:hypothetical protein QJU77_01280 [Pasteurella atlantica]|nr:hypothetical protein [Pasteurella atlantica]
MFLTLADSPIAIELTPVAFVSTKPIAIDFSPFAATSPLPQTIVWSSTQQWSEYNLSGVGRAIITGLGSL